MILCFDLFFSRELWCVVYACIVTFMEGKMLDYILAEIIRSMTENIAAQGLVASEAKVES
jgi:hypothetical protein